MNIYSVGFSPIQQNYTQTANQKQQPAFGSTITLSEEAINCVKTTEEAAKILTTVKVAVNDGLNYLINLGRKNEETEYLTAEVLSKSGKELDVIYPKFDNYVLGKKSVTEIIDHLMDIFYSPEKQNILAQKVEKFKAQDMLIHLKNNRY